MVNINIEIPDHLHRKLKLASTLADTTLKAYIITALTKRLHDTQHATRASLQKKTAKAERGTTTRGGST